MYQINIIYNKELIEDEDVFRNVEKDLKLKYDKSISFDAQSKIKFQIIFNSKVIYSIEDSFGSDLMINASVLSKVSNYIDNAIKQNNSKDISPVDDIWIDDF